MKRAFAMVLVAAMLLLCGCNAQTNTAEKSDKTLNGIDISQYTIVYDFEDLDYCQRAAEYIQTQIAARTGITLPIQEDGSGNYAHEIIVGNTNRDLSAQIIPKGRNMEFYITADENHIALNGAYFIVAAAAYYFVETYIPGNTFQSVIPTNEKTVCQPITEEANNFIYLIGDGMGTPHTQLPEKMDIGQYTWDTDGENIFYGYYLPYKGTVHTNSLSGVTDSAAGATALACGYKTINGYVGKDQNGENVRSLTELAGSLGMATAVMSTDLQTGATPAGFSAHAMDRDDSGDILDTQAELQSQYNTLICCNLNSKTTYQEVIMETLTKLEANENGFFLMYEEAYIDKHCHNKDLTNTAICMARFNQAIGIFMEYAFYHPDTFLIITADHETGGLTISGSGEVSYTSTNHTGADVPIFGYGQGAEMFHNNFCENSEIPIAIAALWGDVTFGY